MKSILDYIKVFKNIETYKGPGPRIGLDTGGPLTMDMLNSFTKIKEFDQAWQQYKRGGGKWRKGTFFKAWAPENMAQGGRIGFDKAGIVNLRGQHHAETAAAKFKDFVEFLIRFNVFVFSISPRYPGRDPSTVFRTN